MQSGYGVPETQQFMLDGCTSSLLSISPEISNSSQPQKQHLQYHHLHLQQIQQQQQQQQRYVHFQHHIPITQPFFQHHHYPFQAFQHLQQRQLHLDQESGPENSPVRVVGGSGSPFVVANFKLAVDDNSDSRRDFALNDYDQVLRGRREDGSNRDGNGSDPLQQREEDSTLKWKPLGVEYINSNNKRCRDKMENSFDFCKKREKGVDIEEGKSSGSNFGLFGELEAIYTTGNGGNNQTGSSSALTSDNPPTAAAVLRPGDDPRAGVDHASETSTGEEASLKLQKNKKKKKRKQLGTIAVFFKGLVKKLMEHQESLHKKFLEVMEKRDQERMNREEAWRQQEAAKSNQEAMSRAQEHALASSREAAIVAFLEKITGESINLPTNTQIQYPSEFHEESHRDANPMEAVDIFNNNDTSNDNTNSNNVDSTNMNITRRWPKAEVQALIQVRSSFELKFQEPGLKGPLWEQVSSSMASMGYQRSAKRCKEKWENINKYFRKTKDNAKKRSKTSKTCPYFHQLDQLYSKSPNPDAIVVPKDRSELLDAIVVPPDHGNPQNPRLEFPQEQIDIRRGFNFSNMGSLELDFNINGGDNPHEISHDEEEDEEEDDDVEAGEGENKETVQNQGIQREHGDKELPHEPAFFGLES